MVEEDITETPADIVETDVTGEPPCIHFRPKFHYQPPSDRKIGDLFPLSALPEIRGPCFGLEKSKLVQRDYKDVEGNLISPAALNSKLTEGTLVLVMVKFATYIMKEQNKKVLCYILMLCLFLKHLPGLPCSD